MSIKKQKEIQGLVDINGECFEIPEGKRAIIIDEDESIITKKQKEYAVTYKKRREDTTDFIWVRFKYNQPLYMSIKPNVTARMFCLATYTNNEGFTAYKTNIKICLNGINDSLIEELLKVANDEGIITPAKGKYQVNRDYFYRGDMEDSDDNHIRLFSDATRALFSSCNITKHCYMTYILQMIPYVNRQTNILCHNQTEQSIEHIEYMTLKEFLKVLKIDKDGTHTSRIRNELLQFRINDELVVGCFNDVGTMEFVPRGKYAVVNPILYYGGDRSSMNYTKICKLFTDERKKFKSLQ